MDWLKSTNLVKDWVACSLKLTESNSYNTVVAFTINSVANVTLFSENQVLTEVKLSCPACFGLFHPHSLLDTKGIFPELRVGDSTKVPSTKSSCWKLIYNEFGGIF